MKFKNSYGTGTPVGGSSYGTSDIHVADLRVKLQLPGAKFDGDGNETTVAALMPMMIKGHPDFNDTIAPMTTRWFDVGAFTWTAASASISSVLVQVYTFHREITHIPPAPTANLVASSS
jgi:hypothetical protein